MIEVMGKYLRLLRLQDQYLQLGCALAAGVYLHFKTGYFWWWAIAVTLISFSTFITNEMVDREDVDKYSWNKVHLRKSDRLDKRTVSLMWWVCSLFGLMISFGVGLFFFGLLMLLIGTIYSAKPIRLKARPVFDILAQLSVWWWIPFVAPVVYFGMFDARTLLFVISLTLLIWGSYYPYQLSDFSADKKAGLRGSHIYLGMGGSLLFGLAALILGLVTYLAFGIYSYEPWSVIFVVVALFSLIHYLFWLRKPDSTVENSMQRYVSYMKPLSWLLVPYIIWWLVL